MPFDEDLEAFLDDQEFAFVMQWTPQGGEQQEANILLNEPHEMMLDDRAVSQETRITGIASKLNTIERDATLTISKRAADGSLTNSRTFRAVDTPRRIGDGAFSEFLANEQ